MGSICKCFIVELSKKKKKEEKNSFNNGQFTYLRIYIKTANRHTGFERLYEYVLSYELHMLEIGLYGTLFGQAPWKFILDLSNRDTIESNSDYIKFISLKNE